MRDQIQIELRTLIDQINNYHGQFGENDIRASFLDGYFEILKTFFCAYYQIEEDDIVKKYHEIYQRDNFERDDLTIHLQGQKNILNSFLIINCWSNFELFITLFCNSVLPKNKIDELLEIDYRRLKKILKGYSITNETDKTLKKFIKNHIAHTPIVNKYGKLLKMINPYPSDRDKQRDREFLEFFGRLRNCIHSNYIYYGAVNKKFTFNDETFTFVHGRIVSQSPIRENSTYLLTKNLKDIFQVIVENINYDLEIYDPSVEIMKE